jgi:uncharacterized membrane protein
MKAWATLERAVEAALTLGVAASAVLLLAGLVFSHEAALRYGIVSLMCTPVARVVVMTAGLFYEGDRRFGLVSLVVLAILAGSIALSRS